MKDRIEVVFLGRSNVGKSTLLNALFGRNFETGRRPGVTLELQSHRYGDLQVTDLPGFGFMSGVPKERREAIKDGIVEYLEENAEAILFAVQVIDASSFIEVVDRWTGRGEVPDEIDLYGLCRDLEIEVVVAANKMDKVEDRERVLDGICERLGMPPPWRQWRDKVASVSGKRSEVGKLDEVIREQLHEAGRDDLLGSLA